jgi:hypothetical protein
MLSLWAGGIGALEYLLNPTVGRLSDAMGRKVAFFLLPAPSHHPLLAVWQPFLLLGPIANLITKANVAMNPTVTSYNPAHEYLPALTLCPCWPTRFSTS